MLHHSSTKDSVIVVHDDIVSPDLVTMPFVICAGYEQCQLCRTDYDVEGFMGSITTSAAAAASVRYLCQHCLTSHFHMYTMTASARRHIPRPPIAKHNSPCRLQTFSVRTSTSYGSSCRLYTPTHLTNDTEHQKNHMPTCHFLCPAIPLIPSLHYIECETAWLQQLLPLVFLNQQQIDEILSNVLLRELWMGAIDYYLASFLRHHSHEWSGKTLHHILSTQMQAETNDLWGDMNLRLESIRECTSAIHELCTNNEQTSQHQKSQNKAHPIDDLNESLYVDSNDRTVSSISSFYAHHPPLTSTNSGNLHQTQPFLTLPKAVVYEQHTDYEERVRAAADLAGMNHNTHNHNNSNNNNRQDPQSDPTIHPAYYNVSDNTNGKRRGKRKLVSGDDVYRKPIPDEIRAIIEAENARPKRKIPKRPSQLPDIFHPTQDQFWHLPDMILAARMQKNENVARIIAMYAVTTNNASTA